MISQPDTPHKSPIPGTTIEIRAIEELMKAHKKDDVRVHCLESAAATVDKAITNMETYNCIHFACHASQNTSDALKSGFALYDGLLDLASITRKRLVGADLAFLSACQTSTGDEKLSEEAVHLAAGMLAAGYRGVVATMWSISDNYAPGIAREFYSSLMEGQDGLNGDQAARALHYAVQKLRKKIGDSERDLLIWVPYVHFGL
jgi:CHAT domain-containing protein